MKTKTKLKRTVMLLAVLLLALIPFSAFAAETTLSTTVPSEFSVKIEIEGKGSVIVDGVEYFENAEIVVDRNEEISYKILSAEGYEIKSVFFNDADVTRSLKDGVITIFADGDGVLKVTFSAIPESPKTGDDSNLIGAILMMMLSLAMIIVMTAWIIKNKKEQS